MSEVRKYLLGFLYRTAVCACVFLAAYILGRLWPDGLDWLMEKLFYPVDYSRLAMDLKDLARCVLPG